MQSRKSPANQGSNLLSVLQGSLRVLATSRQQFAFLVNAIRVNIHMKIPKLKYYYHALSLEEYSAFEHSRTIEVSGSVVYDINLQAMQGRTHIWLTGAAVTCDQEYRDRTRSWAPVIVLRIAAEDIRRDLLAPVANRILVYHYPATLTIPHCGVERIELALNTHTEPDMYTIALDDHA